MSVYKRVFRMKRMCGFKSVKVPVTFAGIFLLGIIPLILWQVSDEDRG